MNGKKAKQLRKLAVSIEKEEPQLKQLGNGMIVHAVGTERSVYQRLKKHKQLF